MPRNIIRKPALRQKTGLKQAPAGSTEPAPAPRLPTDNASHLQGEKAAKAGQPLEQNLYPPGTSAHDAFQRGLAGAAAAVSWSLMMPDDIFSALDAHPLAGIFPMMSGDELAELAADIKANGLIHPIMLSADGALIVDGRNRRAACKLAGVEPTFERLNGQDPAAYIVSANLTRRNLTKGQAAMAMAMIYPEPKRGRHSEFRGGTGEVSATRLSMARAVLRFSPELAAAVLANELSLDVAHEQATALDRKRRREEEARRDFRELAPDLAARVDQADLTLAEARVLYDERDRADREVRRSVFHMLRDLVDRAASALNSPTVLAFPRMIVAEEHQSEFREYFRGGVPELIEGLRGVRAAADVADQLISQLDKGRPE